MQTKFARFTDWTEHRRDNITIIKGSRAEAFYARKEFRVDPFPDRIPSMLRWLLKNLHNRVSNRARSIVVGAGEGIAVSLGT